MKTIGSRRDVIVGCIIEAVIAPGRNRNVTRRSDMHIDADLAITREVESSTASDSSGADAPSGRGSDTGNVVLVVFAYSGLAINCVRCQDPIVSHDRLTNVTAIPRLLAAVLIGTAITRSVLHHEIRQTLRVTKRAAGSALSPRIMSLAICVEWYSK